MRKRKFRGKALDNSRYFNKNEWIVGWGIQVNQDTEESTEEAILYTTVDNGGLETKIHVLVDPETVGDYVFDDINGTEVFEGDILEADRYYFDESYYGILFFDVEDRSYFVEAAPRANAEINGISEGVPHGIEEYKWRKVGNIFDDSHLLKQSYIDYRLEPSHDSE